MNTVPNAPNAPRANRSRSSYTGNPVPFNLNDDNRYDNNRPSTPEGQRTSRNNNIRKHDEDRKEKRKK